MYVVLFVTSLVLLYRRKRVRKQNTAHGPILYLMIALFACCTTHFAIEFNHFYTILVRRLPPHYRHSSQATPLYWP